MFQPHLVSDPTLTTSLIPKPTPTPSLLPYPAFSFFHRTFQLFHRTIPCSLCLFSALREGGHLRQSGSPMQLELLAVLGTLQELDRPYCPEAPGRGERAVKVRRKKRVSWGLGGGKPLLGTRR